MLQFAPNCYSIKIAGLSCLQLVVEVEVDLANKNMRKFNSNMHRCLTARELNE